MAADALNVRCIRCGAEGLIQDNGVCAPCRWVIAWGAPLPQVCAAAALRAERVDQPWEGPGWPWRCPRCASPAVALGWPPAPA